MMLIKSPKSKLFYTLIILSSFFVYCEDEPDRPNQQFAVWRGGEAISAWVDVYRSGSVEIYIANNTGAPDTTMMLNDEQLNAMEAMEADFGNYLSDYPSVICDFDGDFTYRVILTTLPSDTTWTCGTTSSTLPASLSTGLTILKGFIDNSF